MPSFLTPLQKQVLTALFSGSLGARGYFLTGGTALAEYHLGHRLSDDLDLFIRDPGRSIPDDGRWIVETLAAIGLDVEVVRSQKDKVDLLVGTERLKVDLARDVQVFIEAPEDHDGVQVDSLLDIAANKIAAVAGRFEAKDFVDLYFLLQQPGLSLTYLVDLASRKDTKFEADWGLLEFAANLDRVTELPISQKVRMIKPLDIENMIADFQGYARRIIDQYRPGG